MNQSDKPLLRLIANYSAGIGLVLFVVLLLFIPSTQRPIGNYIALVLLAAALAYMAADWFGSIELTANLTAPWPLVVKAGGGFAVAILVVGAGYSLVTVQRRVVGFVYDSKTNNPVDRASVTTLGDIQKSATLGTETNGQGRFELDDLVDVDTIRVVEKDHDNKEVPAKTFRSGQKILLDPESQKWTSLTLKDWSKEAKSQYVSTFELPEGINDGTILEFRLSQVSSTFLKASVADQFPLEVTKGLDLSWSTIYSAKLQRIVSLTPKGNAVVSKDELANVRLNVLIRRPNQ